MEIYLSKMLSTVVDREVNYFLKTTDDEIYMNELIGKTICIEFLNEIKCIKCGRITDKSFSQGYCYPCSRTAPETESCVLHPQTCLAHEGIARDMEYAHSHCLSEQVVYLANTGDLKIGVTRISQIPTRWVDQGAEYALPIAIAPNRYTAGIIEVELKKHVNDKTNWRKMLSTIADSSINLLDERTRIQNLFPKSLRNYCVTNYDVTQLQFPVTEYYSKINSFSFEKENRISSVLTGIKGQYLIFSDGIVCNIRKYSGYKVNLII